jgi:hypothetical protein
VFQAVKNGVDYFLTVEKKTMLRRRAAVENCCEIKVVNPKEMVQVIETLPGGGALSVTSAVVSCGVIPR